MSDDPQEAMAYTLREMFGRFKLAGWHHISDRERRRWNQKADELMGRLLVMERWDVRATFPPPPEPVKPPREPGWYRDTVEDTVLHVDEHGVITAYVHGVADSPFWDFGALVPLVEQQRSRR